MINYSLTADERASLIVRIFSDHNEVEMVRCLSGDNAQAFIDTIDEASLCALLHPKSRFPLKLPYHVGQVLDIIPSDIRGTGVLIEKVIPLRSFVSKGQ